MALTLVWIALLPPKDLDAQLPDDSVAAPSADRAEPSLPVFVTLGVGYGVRTDPCTLCASPLDDESFTGHLSVGRPLGRGLAVGIDGSVWMRSRPGTPGPADSTGAAAPSSLGTMLGNASLTASYQVSVVWLRAGAGFAWGLQDVETAGTAGDPAVVRASGKGIGYTLGAGLKLPVSRLISIAFFGHWNAGRYDLATPTEIVARESWHRYYELGFGVTLR